MVAYQAARQVRARLRALAAVYAVVVGTTTTLAARRRLPSGRTTPRTTAVATMASALFATPTVGYFCKEIIKQLPLLRKCGSAQ